MKQTSIEGTEPKQKRSAAELAAQAEQKAREYRRKAVYASNRRLNKLRLEIDRALAGSVGIEGLDDMRNRLFDAEEDLNAHVDKIAGNG